MSYKKINETKVYKLSFQLAMNIFEVTKKFPREDMYSLTDQGKKIQQKCLFIFARST